MAKAILKIRVEFASAVPLKKVKEIGKYSKFTRENIIPSVAAC